MSILIIFTFLLIHQVFSFDVVLVREYTYTLSEFKQNQCSFKSDLNDTEFKEEYVRTDLCYPLFLSPHESERSFRRYTYLRKDGDVSTDHMTRITCPFLHQCENPLEWDEYCTQDSLKFGCEKGIYLTTDDNFYIPNDITPGILLSYYSDKNCKNFIKFSYEYVRNDSYLTHLEKSYDCIPVSDDYYIRYVPLQRYWIGMDQWIIAVVFLLIIKTLVLHNICIFCYIRLCVTRPYSTKRKTSIQSNHDDYEQLFNSNTEEEEETFFRDLNSTKYNSESSTFNSSTENRIKNDEDCPCFGVNILYIPNMLDHYNLQFLWPVFCCFLRRHRRPWDFGKQRVWPAYICLIMMCLSSIFSFIMFIPIIVSLYDMIKAIAWEPFIFLIINFFEVLIVLPTLGVDYYSTCCIPSILRKRKSVDIDELLKEKNKKKTQKEKIRDFLKSLKKSCVCCCYIENWIFCCSKFQPIFCFPIFLLLWITTAGYLFVKTVAFFSSNVYVFETTIISLFTISCSSKFIVLSIWFLDLTIRSISVILHFFIRVFIGFDNNENDSKKMVDEVEIGDGNSD